MTSTNSLIEEISQYVSQHGLNAAVKRYASALASWPGEPAGIWLRVSSGGQDESNQLPDVLKHCAKHVYRPVLFYVLHDKSASKGEQQAKIDEMLTDMREGRFTVLVPWYGDRLDRRGGIFILNLLADIRDAGGRAESALEGRLGLETMGDRLGNFVKGEMAEAETALKRERVRIGQDRVRANNGVLTDLPWGYTAIGPKYAKVASPSAECIVFWPHILQWCATGDSSRTICKWLDFYGVKTDNGGPWHEDTLRRNIKNSAYCGRRLGWTDAPLLESEAVVSVDLWKRANDALSNRPKQGPRTGRKNPVRPKLAKLKCARCGSPMWRIHKSKRDPNHYNYRCGGSGPNRKGCGNAIDLEALETRVVEHFSVWQKPHQTRQWIEGRNWDAELSDTMIAINELAKQGPQGDVTSWAARMAELGAQQVEYERKNKPKSEGGEREGGDWEYIDAHNPDGSVMTEGQYFASLTLEGQREYLKTHLIQAKRIGTGFVVLVDVGIIDGQAVVTDRSAILYDSEETMLADAFRLGQTLETP